MNFGVIGGTGFGELDLPKLKGDLCAGRWYSTHQIGDHTVTFTNRHGKDKTAPHRIDYTTTPRHFKREKIDAAIGVTACGSLRAELTPGSLCVPKHPFDMTGRQRKASIINDATHPIATDIHDRQLREALGVAYPAFTPDCIVSIPGPRFATLPESLFYAQIAELINMTTATEANAFLEFGIPYAVLAVVTDYDQGAVMGVEPATYEEIKARFEQTSKQIADGLSSVFSRYARAVEE